MPSRDGAAWDWRNGNAWSRDWDVEQKRDRAVPGPALARPSYIDVGPEAIVQHDEPVPAQRVAWMLTYGSIEPEELQVDHIDCVTKLCMNPEHLQLLTLEENVRKG